MASTTARATKTSGLTNNAAALGSAGQSMVIARRLLAGLMAVWCYAGLASQAPAQRTGGILKVYSRDSPSSMSILEESTLSTVLPMMGVFNNLVVYDQHVA